MGSGVVMCDMGVKDITSTNVSWPSGLRRHARVNP